MDRTVTGELFKLDFPDGGSSFIGFSKAGAEAYFKFLKATRPGRNSPLARAWAYYGEPRMTVLATLPAAELPEARIKAIAEHQTFWPKGYNDRLSVGLDKFHPVLAQILRIQRECNVVTDPALL